MLIINHTYPVVDVLPLGNNNYCDTFKFSAKKYEKTIVIQCNRNMRKL
jgi:hypothetical protein